MQGFKRLDHGADNRHAPASCRGTGRAADTVASANGTAHLQKRFASGSVGGAQHRFVFEGEGRLFSQQAVGGRVVRQVIAFVHGEGSKRLFGQARMSHGIGRLGGRGQAGRGGLRRWREARGEGIWGKRRALAVLIRRVVISLAGRQSVIS